MRSTGSSMRARISTSPHGVDDSGGALAVKERFLARWAEAQPLAIRGEMARLQRTRPAGIVALIPYQWLIRLPGQSYVPSCAKHSTTRPERLAPAVGFEPTTKRLTAARSTTELRRNARRTIGRGPDGAVAMIRAARHRGQSAERR